MVYPHSTMILLVFLPLIWPVISAHLYNLECGPKEVPDFTIEPSEDGVVGRFLVQWCSQLANPTIEKWTFFLLARNASIKDCEFYKITDKEYIHSRIEQKIHKTLECPAKTCISTYLDLVYTGCYSIRSEFHLAQNQRSKDYRLRYMHGLSSLDDINQMKSAFTTESLGENIMLKIDSRIPLTDYYVKLCCDEECSYIEEMCTVSRVPGLQVWSARCVAPTPTHTTTTTLNYTQATHDHVAAGPLQLSALLTHVSPWTHGVMFHPDIKDVYCNFSYSREGWRVAAIGSGSANAVGAVGGYALLALAVAVLTVAALALTRCQRRKEINKQHRYNTMPCALPGKCPAPPSDEIVLVYMRDVPPFMRAVHCLTQAIHDNGIGRVVSPYSAATAAASGGAGGAGWARGARARGARVLLLQTATLRHATRPLALVPHGSSATVCGSQFGDTLVTLALRCLFNAHADEAAYRTYYVANLSVGESESGVEVVPLVSPYRRYELPEALPTLLDHLAPGAVTNTESMVKAMQHMSEYLDYVRENPDYLNDLSKHAH